MHFVKDVNYLGDYKLKITFENNISKLVDLQPYLEGEIFKPLKDVGYFKNVSVNSDIDTIVWPNNADFSPEFLFEIGNTDNE